jgi:hypothetical protein
MLGIDAPPANPEIDNEHEDALFIDLIRESFD